jgi:ADP-ribosyl-[dinitrogen reductase] hydrolase
MEEIIAKGGDTDTNACIVGGLVGSIVGFKLLPCDLLCKMLTLDLSK